MLRISGFFYIIYIICSIFFAEHHLQALSGDMLPVNVFPKYGTFDGSWKVDTAACEKRGVEVFVPALKGETTRLPMCLGEVTG